MKGNLCVSEVRWVAASAFGHDETTDQNRMVSGSTEIQANTRMRNLDLIRKYSDFGSNHT